MKIALCFAGQPRFINLMNFDNLIQDHEIKTYGHFWWDDDYRGDMFAWNSDLKYPDCLLYTSDAADEVVQIIIKLFAFDF